MATTRIEIEQRAADNAAALAARDGEIFGDYLEDVRYLRTRDFSVQREGSNFLVDDKVVDGPTLRALADRERRLRGTSDTPAEPVTGIGLKVGDSVPYTRPRRKAARKRSIACACGGCIPARQVLEIVADLERLVAALAGKGPA